MAVMWPPIQLTLDQKYLDDFLFRECFARLVCEDDGTLRIKLPVSVWKSLGIPDRGEYVAYVRGYCFRGRYDATAGLRLRIPKMYKPLFHEELALKNNAIIVGLWLEDILRVEYRYGERPLFTPKGECPQYDKGDKYCAKCREVFRGDLWRCPNCRTVLRGGRRKKSYITSTIVEEESS